ncbi:rhodanese-like domain-containing protein [Polaribacter sp. SA4-12]|uniref:rhodanese-like domain-containing protein n=1 Tax=Polaribacter sp. SA4-12 TaxID=1312072 RepID=UPI000B3BF248|nr:rhodanese-like domain-containing protein [Polaribacter sp. SA4-12]ARV16050.1 rhodanese-like domain-containing protein [Polaribacter sp. SA4-12]
MKQLIFILFASFLFINCAEVQEGNAITTLALKELLSKDKIQLIDVRTQKEVKYGAIETALFVNFFDTDFTAKAIQKLDKNKPVYVYCRTGNRSGKATKILQDKGFEVYNVLGGYNKWKQENKK